MQGFQLWGVTLGPQELDSSGFAQGFLVPSTRELTASAVGCCISAKAGKPSSNILSAAKTSRYTDCVPAFWGGSKENLWARRMMRSRTPEHSGLLFRKLK